MKIECEVCKKLGMERWVNSVEEKELGVTLKQHRGEREGRSQAEGRALRERRGVSTD